MSNRKYGWKKQRPDSRDFRFTRPTHLMGVLLPSVVDMRPECPPVYDQLNLGACTGNAWAGMFSFLLLKELGKLFNPSRLFIYWHERVLEGTVSQDSGAEIRDGAKTLADKGVCAEENWPYDVSKFAVCPPTEAFGEAYHRKLLKYEAINNTDLTEMKLCLASGYPIVAGFAVFQSFESDAVAKTGVVPMPGANEQPIGGHAVLIVGYDDIRGVFIVRNSWGADWGDKGYFTVPYAYFTDSNLASDFWTATLVD